MSESDLRYRRKLVEHRVAEEMPEIVEKFAEKAKGGSIEHAIALLKLSSGDPGKGSAKADATKPRRFKSFAGELFKELKKTRERSPEEVAARSKPMWWETAGAAEADREQR